MKTILIIDNLEGEIGAYCNRRIETFFTEDFNCLFLNAIHGELPEDVEAYVSEKNIAAAVILGSGNSPLDDEKWIREEEDFVRKWLLVELPMLGICFGHEILVSALGGGLERKPELTVAFPDIEIKVKDALFEGFGNFFRQPVAHEVQACSAPEDFVVLACTEGCPIQAMRHNRLPIYSVQFHPEIDRNVKLYDKDWTPLPDSQLDDFDGPALIENFKKIVVFFHKGR